MSLVQLFEGKVTRLEEVQRDFAWKLIHVRGKEKPLAVRISEFEGQYPSPGDRVSVQALEGRSWWFAQHRSMVVKKGPEPHVDFITVPKTLILELEEYVLAELSTIDQISSDNVHDGIMERVGDRGYSPKIVGMVFRSLAQKRKIHKIGRTKTKRPEAHGREIVVWERNLRK